MRKCTTDVSLLKLMKTYPQQHLLRNKLDWKFPAFLSWISKQFQSWLEDFCEGNLKQSGRKMRFSRKHLLSYLFQSSLSCASIFIWQTVDISLKALQKNKINNNIIIDKWADDCNYWKIQAWMGFKLLPMRCWFSSQPVELLDQLGADS